MAAREGPPPPRRPTGRQRGGRRGGAFSFGSFVVCCCNPSLGCAVNVRGFRTGPTRPLAGPAPSTQHARFQLPFATWAGFSGAAAGRVGGTRFVRRRRMPPAFSFPRHPVRQHLIRLPQPRAAPSHSLPLFSWPIEVTTRRPSSQRPTPTPLPTDLRRDASSSCPS